MATNTEKNTAIDFNFETGEQSIRQLSDAELSEMKASSDEITEATKAKVAARQSALAKLAELGLTADEIAAL